MSSDECGERLSLARRRLNEARQRDSELSPLQISPRNRESKGSDDSDHAWWEEKRSAEEGERADGKKHVASPPPRRPMSSGARPFRGRSPRSAASEEQEEGETDLASRVSERGSHGISSSISNACSNSRGNDGNAGGREGSSCCADAGRKQGPIQVVGDGMAKATAGESRLESVRLLAEGFVGEIFSDCASTASTSISKSSTLSRK